MSSAMDDPQVPRYFAYWGKAQPVEGGISGYHLLAFHSLDVAACGEALLRLPRFSLAPMASELGWPLADLEHLFVYFLGLHDLGKFARAFQSLAPDLSSALVPSDLRKRYTQRHDTLGWLVWRDHLADLSLHESLPQAADDFWADWIRTAVGHHGMPPREVADGGSMCLRAKDYFLPEDVQAAQAFAIDLAALLLPESLPFPARAQQQCLRRYAWQLAGLAVLADWLGSNQAFFDYQDQPLALSEYWQNVARSKAEQAVRGAGLSSQLAMPWQGPQALFDYLQQPTPLQRYAAEVELEEGAQLFLLEDVTGAGKTEAALILVQRLMSAGLAQGLYFALPSMATANQMYRRVGEVYRGLYQASASPSLVLAHGARQLVEGFRQSVLQVTEQTQDFDYRPDEGSATTQCSAWLADSRKKALLADVGVGTLDQALLAVLPARHQSLRLLGLAGKVLLVDEVHAYDTYMSVLLKTLLTAHARQGGSVILLSATLPANQRAELVAAFQFGRGAPVEELSADSRYPLATQVGAQVRSQACATRAQLVRNVSVVPLHSEAEVLDLIATQAAAGRCVCWIRNTVEDARRAHAALESLQPDAALLFHSRYAMGDRLTIENCTLERFGKDSTAAMRRSQVLIATQVVEQSLDLDFDVLISDLAPIDLLIQRAGRLQRHRRDANGEPTADAEGRAAPVLYLHCPESDEQPKADWYAASFPKACYVYPNIGQLWLTQRALLAAGSIVSPGQPGQVGSVRSLVEAVYDEEAESMVPEALQKATNDELGKQLADISQAHFNVLKLHKGYCQDSSHHWYEDTRVPTRLGDESLTLYLAREGSAGLQPLIDAEQFPWEQSAVRIDARVLKALAPEWLVRFGSAIESLRQRYRVLADPAFVLPLVADGDAWEALGSDERGRVVRIRYDKKVGFLLEKGE